MALLDHAIHLTTRTMIAFRAGLIVVTPTSRIDQSSWKIEGGGVSCDKNVRLRLLDYLRLRLKFRYIISNNISQAVCIFNICYNMSRGTNYTSNCYFVMINIIIILLK